jgi:hypothetical protein
MLKRKGLLALAASALMAAACAHNVEGSAAGDVIDPADAARTVVLHVSNGSTESMELRTVLNGSSQFVGSVGANDSTNILLDPTMFPTGTLFVLAIPASGHGRAVVGPLAASKGDRINFKIQPALDLSSAAVNR